MHTCFVCDMRVSFEEYIRGEKTQEEATEQKDRYRDNEGMIMTVSITVTHTGTLHGSEALSAMLWLVQQ